MSAVRFQIQLRWSDHPKGADHWQTMSGVFKTRASAEARLARSLRSGAFIDGRIVERS